MRKTISLMLTLLILGGLNVVLLDDTTMAESPGTGIGPLAAHTPIRINSDADFDAAHGVTGGSGTLAYPYIIENWTIDGTGVGYGIYIGNTTAYFVIRNCTIQSANGVGSEPYFSNSNIALYNVTNGVVTNVTSTNAANNGIYLLGWSHNDIIYNNNVTSNGYGIVLYRANDTNIVENTVNSSISDGIRLDTAYGNTISANTVINSGNIGVIFVRSCNNNVVEDNTVNDNNWDGFQIVRSNNTVLMNNTARNNGFRGIYVENSNNTTIESQRTLWNTGDGLVLFGSTNTSVAGLLTKAVSGSRAVYVENGHDITISDSNLTGYNSSWTAVFEMRYSSRVKISNTSIGNSSGRIVYLYYPSDVLFDGCNLWNSNTYGMYVYHGDGVKVYNSTFNNMGYRGFYEQYSSNTVLENNTFTGCINYGIFLDYTSEGGPGISNNTIIGSYVGIYLNEPYATIMNNTMVHTGLYIARWDYRDVIENNTVNGKPLFYAYNINDLTVPPGMGEIILFACSNFNISGQNLSDGTVGMQIASSYYGKIYGNEINNNHLFGIWLQSHDDSIENNTIRNSTHEMFSRAGSGIYMRYAQHNYIANNTISYSKYGILLDYGSTYNTFRENSLIHDGFYVIFGHDELVVENDVDLSNTVNGLPVYFIGNERDFTVPANSAGQVIIGASENITVEQQGIANSTTGAEIFRSSNISMEDVDIRDESKEGIAIIYSNNISIDRLYMEPPLNMWGLFISGSENVSVSDSTFRDAYRYGLYVGGVSKNISVRNNGFYNSYEAIRIDHSYYGEVLGCDMEVQNGGIEMNYGGEPTFWNISNNRIKITYNYGIDMSRTNHTILSNNDITGSIGIYMYSCSDAEIYGNNFDTSSYGINIYRYAGYGPYIPSKIYHNNFMNKYNTGIYMYNAYNDTLNLSYPSGGNYYAGYDGVDYRSGPNQDLSGSDGIGDIPYNVHNGVDHYPLIFPYGSVPTRLANSSWPMLNHDISHTGATDVNGPPLPIEYWNFSASDAVISSPAVARDGTVYFGSMNGEFYALNPDGTLKWNFTVGANISSSPAIAEDGTIYFGAMDGMLHALNPNGTEKWNFSTAASGGIQSSPVIATDGMIYVGDDSGYFYALNDDGTERWASFLGSMINSSPSIGTDGMVYVSRYAGGTTFAFYPKNGTLRWTYTQPGNISAAPTVFNNGSSDIILICSDTGNVSAVAENGTYIGGMDVDGAILGAPAIRNNVIYIATYNGTLYSVIPDVGIQWTFHADGPIEGSVALDDSGNIYFGTGGATPKIYALDPSGNELWNYTVSYGLRSSPAIADGLLLMGGDGGLYCMGDITPPTVNITAPTEGQIIESDSVTVTWSGSDSESGIDHYEVRLDGGNWTSVGNSTQHTFTGLNEGAHMAEVMATDAAGNTATDSVNFTVDTYPPVINITYPANGSLLNVNQTTVTWEGSDNGTGIEHYEIRLDGGSWMDVGANTTYELKSLEEGEHTVEVRAFDGTGKNTTGTVSFTVDTTPPEISITAPSDGEILTATTVTVMWAGLDSGSGIDYYEVSVDSGTFVNVDTNTTYVFNGPDGTHEVTVRAIDVAGNENTSSVSFIVDTTPPEVIITEPSVNSMLNTNTVTVRWTGSDAASGVAYYLVRMDGDMWINTGSNTSYTFTGLSDGNHTVEVRVTDRAGFLNLTAVNFIIDSTAPEVISTTPAENSRDVHISANITIHFSEPIDISSFGFSCTPNPGGWELHWSVDRTALTMTHAEFFYATTYVLRINASDDAGNQMDTYTLPFTTTDMGTITGRITDENGNPIIGARITLDTGETAITDENGEFSIQAHAGNHTITVSKDGYEEKTSNVTVTPGETTELPPLKLPEAKETADTTPIYVLSILVLLGILGAALFLLKRRGSGGREIKEGTEAVETGPGEEPTEGNGEEMEGGPMAPENAGEFQEEGTSFEDIETE